MASSEQSRDQSLNLVIYPSNLVGASRVGKIANSLHSSGEFELTYAVGMGISGENLPLEEKLSPGVLVKRIKVPSFPNRILRLLSFPLWSRKVMKEFSHCDVKTVSAQRALVLPLAHRLARKTGAVFVYNAHELETEILGFTGIKQKIFKYIERRYIKHVDVISVVNDSIADWYINEYPGIPRPIVLTNTPIDDGKNIDLRAELQIPEGELLYVHVGYISPGRNVPLILREFARNPKVHLVFLGDGDFRKNVEEAAEKYPNIHWHPMVTPDQVVSYVRGADIGLCLVEYASLSDELSTPNKLLESWVAGIPPLSSGLQEAKRLLGPELSKTWVIESPEEQLANALTRLTMADIVKFKKEWKPITSWDEQATDLIDAYRKAIAQKRKTRG